MLIAQVKAFHFFPNVNSFVHTRVDPTSSAQLKHLKLNENCINNATSTDNRFEDQVGKESNDDCLFGDDIRSFSASS